MGEVKAPDGGATFDDQAGDLGGFEPIEQGGTVDVDHARKEAEVELVPEYRCSLERLDGDIGQPVDSTEDHLLDVRRHDVLDGAGIVSAALARDHLQDLGDEERVAACVYLHRRQQFVGRCCSG